MRVRAFLFYTGLLLAGLPGPGLAEDAVERTALVPYDQLQLLLDGGSRRVMLSTGEYSALKKRARAEDEALAPLGLLAETGIYQVRVQGDHALISGELGLRVLREGLQSWTLPLSTLGLLDATLDGKAAALGAAGPAAPLELFVGGLGVHQLKFEAITPLQTTAARQSLQFELPIPPACRMMLSIPGDVELKSGAAVTRRVFDAAKSETRFDLLPTPGAMSLVMTLNSRLKQQERTVVARSLLVADLSPEQEVLRANVTLEVLHRPVERFDFTLPAGFEITRVETTQLSHWELKPGSKQDAPQQLAVYLREETSGEVTLLIEAYRRAPDLAAWQFPVLRPVDTVGQVCVAGLRLAEGLKARSFSPKALIPIEHRVLDQALAITGKSGAENSMLRFRPVAAYFAPQAEYDVRGSFYRPDPRVEALSNLLLVLGDEGATLKGGYALTPEGEGLFDTEFSLPDGWELRTVTDGNNQPLAHESYPDAEERQRVRVQFPSEVQPGASTAVFFEAHHVPAGWFSRWSEKRIAFPDCRMPGATRESGALAIDARDDLEALPVVLEGLTPLDETEKARYGLPDTVTSLAYRYEEPPFRASFALTRRSPQLTAESYAFFRIAQDQVLTRYEIVFTVDEARSDELQFDLPAIVPANLHVQGLSGTSVKEYRSEVLEDGSRRWTVRLEGLTRERIHLAIDTPLPLTENEMMALPLPHARKVKYQSGYLAIEGSPELEVRIDAAPLKVDVGELVDAEYIPGRRLLGAYSYIGTPPACAIEAQRHALHPLPAAIIDQARLTTQISAQGKSQTELQYTLHTAQPYLALELPAGSELWAALVNGRSIEPRQSEGAPILLAMPDDVSADGRHTLRVVYETPVPKLGFRGRLQLPAARVFLQETPDGILRQEVPVTDLHWTLRLPDGFEVLSSRGSVEAQDIEPTPLAATRVAQWLYFFSGGINPAHGLAGCAIAPLASTASTSGKYARDVAYESAAAATGGEMQAQMELSDPRNRFKAPAARPTPVPIEPTPDSVDDRLSQRKIQHLKPGGFRSLEMSLAGRGEVQEFAGLGDQPVLDIRLVHQRRYASLAWAAGLATFLAGLALTQRKRRTRMGYVMLMLLGSTLLAALPGLFGYARVFNAAFYAACSLVPYYLCMGIGRRILGGLRRAFIPTSSTALLLALASSCFLGNPVAEAAKDTPPPPPIVVPDDVLISPYRAGAAASGKDSILVPYARYQKLWERAYPDEAALQKPPPAPFALAGARFSATLSGDEFIDLTGRIEVEVFAEKGVVEIPLPLAAGVLRSARLDGQPARLTFIQPEPAQQMQKEMQQLMQSQAANAPASLPPSNPLPVLLVEGAGRHQLDLGLRMRVSRRGGWRMLRGTLPPCPALRLELRVPDAGSEVVIAQEVDQRTVKTEQADQRLVTSLPRSGGVNLQWRSPVSEGDIDRSLTVTSTTLLDLREDQLHVEAELQFQFRRGERESFSVQVPANCLVAGVIGDNVRGWEALDPEGAEIRDIKVTLLKPARGTEQFRISLWRPLQWEAGQAVKLEAPRIQIPEALRHTGQLALRRSPWLDVQVQELDALRRTDQEQTSFQRLKTLAADESPLGLRDYQAFSFASPAHRLALELRPVQPELEAEFNGIYRLADEEQHIEVMSRLDVGKRPVYTLQYLVPADVEITRVQAPGNYEWDLQKDAAGEATLSLFSADGFRGKTLVVIAGRIKRDLSAGGVPLPRISLLHTKRQTGTWVIQADPSYDVAAQNLQGIDKVLPRRVEHWLAAGQRELTRLVLEYSLPGYSGDLVLVRRKPVVSATSVLNVRVSDRSIEETLLIDYQIAQAGKRVFRFRLPEHLATARISVPLLRNKEVVPSADAPGWVQVTLELQDEVLNQLRILVEHDRLLTTDAQTSYLPQLLDSEVQREYVAIESAGRDEVVVDEVRNLSSLNRRHEGYRKLAELFKGGSSQAFYAEGGHREAASLTYHIRARDQIETAGARIGLARTTLVLDEAGGYRAEQIYQVDNQTEQFLGLLLPEGARVWSVRVSGVAVKPIRDEQPSANRIRIPLVKTAAGDLDYEVVLLYSGDKANLKALRSGQGFPFIKTENINVELSQVELRLPRGRKWFGFDGSMRLVEQEGEFEAGLLSYKTKMAKRLVHSLQYGSAWEQARAVGNLKELSSALEKDADQFSNDFYNPNLDKEVSKAEAIVEDANIQLGQVLQVDTQAMDFDNRGGLNDLFDGQSNKWNRNAVLNNGPNWDAPKVEEIITENARQLEGKKKTSGQDFNGWWKSDDGKSLPAGKDRAQENEKLERINEPRKPAKKSKVVLQQKTANYDGRERLGNRRSQEQQAFKYQQVLDARNSVGTGQGMGMQNGLPNNQPEGGERLNLNDELLLNQVDGTINLGGFLQGQQGGQGQGGRGENLPTSAEGLGLASLDARLPSMDFKRWNRYRFTTPRGDIQVTAWSLSTRTRQGLQRLGVFLVALLLCAVTIRSLRGGGLTASGRNHMGTICVLLGALGLVAGILPVAGLILIVYGLIQRMRSRRMARAAAVA